MAMPQRDDTIEAIKRLDALLEYAVMHIRLRRRRQVARRSVATEPRSGYKRPSDEAETERLREELSKLTESARLAALRDFLLPLLMNGQLKIGDVE